MKKILISLGMCLSVCVANDALVKKGKSFMQNV